MSTREGSSKVSSADAHDMARICRQTRNIHLDHPVAAAPGHNLGSYAFQAFSFRPHNENDAKGRPATQIRAKHVFGGERNSDSRNLDSKTHPSKSHNREPPFRLCELHAHQLSSTRCPSDHENYPVDPRTRKTRYSALNPR
ncbi:hypothetical protein BOTBODRAFT_174239 [Botryobasidium botryosum FD-172 SS1]|uniref:Uncharacterized protein n=1 Tax=Botryobasidium botryosum (strain FD-172 SS1) TaxID=930990 RepID=A0A067MU05_BOTB1|nr:hypothetical protein BOTBODRAFT_174239 [Botryobasidium botryosum FD-172 SS1]